MKAHAALRLPLPALPRWPAPPLLAWLLAAALARGLAPITGRVGAETAAIALTWAVAWAWPGLTPRRRLAIAAGFPLALALQGLATGSAALAWLLPPLALLALYPRRAWREAPVYPTPRGALAPLPAHLDLPPAPKVLDAGCGAGDGLLELARALPDASIEGVEASGALARLAAHRCPGARVRRGDMWQESWAGIDLLYIFQRPETMARAWGKACAEMAPGRWLASLAFEIPGVTPQVVWDVPRQRGGPPMQLHLYRVPAASAPLQKAL